MDKSSKIIKWSELRILFQKYTTIGSFSGPSTARMTSRYDVH